MININLNRNQGASVGGVIWPIFLNQLRKHTSFSNSIRATAGLAAVMLILANLLTKTRHVKAVITEKPNYKVILCDYAYLVSIVSYVPFFHSPTRSLRTNDSQLFRAFCISLGLFFPCKYYFVSPRYAYNLV
jgi:hypothetical protein